MTIMKIALLVSGALVVVALIEHTVHRHLMHRVLFDWRIFRLIFGGHAVVHHRQKRNDSNIRLPIYTHVAWGLPSVALVSFFDYAGAVILALAFLFHPLFWTKLHRAIHGVENNWTQSLWFFDAIAHHHLEHHRRPGKNFGAVFIFTDYLFRTASRPERVTQPRSEVHGGNAYTKSPSPGGVIAPSASIL